MSSSGLLATTPAIAACEYDVDASGLLAKAVKIQVKYNKLFINNEWLDSKSGKTFETGR